MIKLGNTSKTILLILVIILCVLRSYSATRTATSSGNWSNTATWGGNPVPIASDDVIINGGVTVTMDVNTAACSNLTIYGIANWTAARTTNVGGNLTISGGTLSGSATGVLNVTGTLTIPTSTTANIQRITITVNGATTVSGTLNFNTSVTGNKTFVGLVTISSDGTWNNTINTPINFRGGISNNGTFNSGTGVQTFSNNNQSVSGTISISSATVTLITLTNNGTLSITTALAGTGGLTQGANDILYLGGTTTISTLTATASGNTVSYNGAAQTVKATTYQNLNLDGSGTKTLGNATTTNGTLTVNTGVTFALSTFLLTINGDLISDGTVSGSTGGVTIGGTANQNIAGFTTTGTVTMSKTAGTATFTGNVNASVLT